MMAFCPEHPKWDQNPKSEIYTPKRDDEYPHPFHMQSTPPPRAFTLRLERKQKKFQILFELAFSFFLTHLELKR